MNIKEAKTEIKNAVLAYRTRDALGNSVIPIEKQRPIFLMGPPGIGKTAIMEQVAQELNIGLVSYSMTHHTRQSALGLPFIAHRTYCGMEFDVSEYTMSEIIASVYEMMETTGVREGILFLDEINCVSETLAPSMLQFLQYKVFGRHRVPEGWIVVTAGNPPEYNNSVREFDIVTWDRLKRIDVEADYPTWKEYAINKGVHPAVITYLDARKADFYTVESTVDGKAFVTARGWDDLSTMIKLYEQQGIPVKQTLVEQYLQKNRVAVDFAMYYDLYVKYRADYQVDRILAGDASDEIRTRAHQAKFDERLALIGQMLDMAFDKVSEANTEEAILKSLLDFLKPNRAQLSSIPVAIPLIESRIDAMRDAAAASRKAGSLSQQDADVVGYTLQELARYRKLLTDASANNGFDVLKKQYEARLAQYRSGVQRVSAAIDNMLIFAADAFGQGQELSMMITELSIHKGCAHFISRNGSREYFRYSQNLLFYERRKDIIAQIEELGL